jgi:hypothetical protein
MIGAGSTSTGLPLIVMPTDCAAAGAASKHPNASDAAPRENAE